MDLDSIVEFFRSLWVVWMMAIFFGIILWAYWPSRRARLQAIAQIPLRDDEPED